MNIICCISSLTEAGKQKQRGAQISEKEKKRGYYLKSKEMKERERER